MIQSLIVLSVISCSIYYIGAYAQVTGGLRRWYPEFLNDLFACAACSGFWIGGYAGFFLLPNLIALEHPWVRLGAAFLLGGLWAMVTTPMLFRVMLGCLNYLTEDLQKGEAESEGSDTKTLEEFHRKEEAEEATVKESLPPSVPQDDLGQRVNRELECERIARGEPDRSPPSQVVEAIDLRLNTRGRIEELRSAAIARAAHQARLDLELRREECARYNHLIACECPGESK